MKKKTAITTSVIIAAALIIGAAVWYSHERKVSMPIPLPEASHTWSTYSNPKREFTLEYPSDVLTSREGDATEPDVVVFERSVHDDMKGEGVEGIQISSQPTTYPDAASYFSQYPKNEYLTPTTIAGLSALKQVDTMHPITTLYFVYGRRLYTLMMNLSPGDMERVQHSFRFVDNTVSAFVSVGDVLGAMTVVSVRPFNTGQYSPDPKMMQLGPQNIQANLKDSIEVTGASSAVHSGIGFNGYCMSVSDAASLARLPALPVSGGTPAVRPYFCFRNSEVVQQKLGEQSRAVTVTIDNYQLNSYPSEVVDWADLVSVVRE